MDSSKNYNGMRFCNACGNILMPVKGLEGNIFIYISIFNFKGNKLEYYCRIHNEINIEMENDSVIIKQYSTKTGNYNIEIYKNIFFRNCCRYLR